MSEVEEAEEILALIKHEIQTKLSAENQVTVEVAANLIRDICGLVDKINSQLELGTVALSLVSSEYNVKITNQNAKFQAALASISS